MSRTGSRHETAAENGVSHFLEHMAFKGTERRSAAEIAEEMDNVGGHLNAYTAREQTAYYAKVLKEDTALAADIIGDILTHSIVRPRRTGARARRHPAGDRPGQRHAGRHHLRPLSGAGLPRPTDRPARAGQRRHRAQHVAGLADGLHAPSLPGRRTWSLRRPARWSTSRSSIWCARHFADLASSLAARAPPPAAMGRRVPRGTRPRPGAHHPGLSFGRL